MPKSSQRFDILGAAFSVTFDEDPIYLETLMGHYRRVLDKTQETTGFTNPLKTAILTGYLLCDEVEKLKARESSGLSVVESQQAEQLADDLIKRIDKAFAFDK